MANKKVESKKDPMDMILDLIDTLNDSVKTIHDRIDDVQKQIDKLTEASSLGSEIHKGQTEINDQFVDMVNRMAKRMGMKNG
tara:strand:- start:21874 stop:22119 length:246 start_codon:yes stop_codon:yes gene_type:complete